MVTRCRAHAMYCHSTANCPFLLITILIIIIIIITFSNNHHPPPHHHHSDWHFHPHSRSWFSSSSKSISSYLPWVTSIQTAHMSSSNHHHHQYHHYPPHHCFIVWPPWVGTEGKGGFHECWHINAVHQCHQWSVNSVSALPCVIQSLHCTACFRTRECWHISAVPRVVLSLQSQV